MYRDFENKLKAKLASRRGFRFDHRKMWHAERWWTGVAGRPRAGCCSHIIGEALR